MPDLDLKSLSNEQLDAYKSLLYSKISSNWEKEASSGTGIGAVKRPPLPEGLAEPKKQTSLFDFSSINPQGGMIRSGIRRIGEGIENFAGGRYSPGISNIIEGAGQALLPVGVAAAIADPLVALGAGMGSYGAGGLGKEISSKLGATPDQARAIGDVASLAPMGIGAEGFKPGADYPTIAKGARAVGSGVKAAAPKVALGVGETGLGIGMVSHLPHPTGYAGYAPMLEGMRQIRGGLEEGLKAGKESWQGGPVEAPVEGPTLKGPSLGMLRQAVKSGSMTMDEFAQHLDKQNLTPETKAMAIRSLNAEVSLSQIEPRLKTPRELSLGDLKSAIKAKEMSIDDYEGELKNRGYNDKSAKIMRNLLEKSLKEEEEEGPKTPPSKVTSIKPEPIGQVNNPTPESIGKQAIPAIRQDVMEAQNGKQGEPQVTGEQLEKQLGEVKNPNGPAEVIPIESHRTIRIGSEEHPAKLIRDLQPPETKHKLTLEEAEEAQAPARKAKEEVLAHKLLEHLNSKTIEDLNSINPDSLKTARELKSTAKLLRQPSPRTIENAVNRAKMLKKAEEIEGKAPKLDVEHP